MGGTKDEPDRLRVVHIEGTKGGQSKVFRVIAMMPRTGDDPNAREPRDDFDRTWRRLSSDGWTLTIGGVLA